MRPFLFAALGVLVLLAGCKGRQGQSSAQSVENDTDAVVRQPNSGLFQVFCRKGRAHPCKDDRGTPQLINGEPVLCTMTYVPKSELSTVCELPDPGGNQGGGGGGGSQGPDLATCTNVPEKVKALSIAFSPAYVQQVPQTPALAKQRLCIGVVTGLKNLVEASQGLFKFLSGETSDAPVLVIIDGKDAPVAYDSESFALTLPWNMTAQTRSQVEQVLAGEGISFCNGKEEAGACWFLAVAGNSCAQACTSVGKSYDVRTMTWAGSGGTNDNCKVLGELWGFPWGAGMNGQGWGCLVANDNKVWRTIETQTTADAAYINFRRICACR